MTTDNLGELAEHLRRLARLPTLLVACDYDGTVADLTDDPMAARPNRQAVTAMRALAELDHTHVTVISGRSLRDLAEMSQLPTGIRLIGSHGSEFDLDFADGLPTDQAQLRGRIVEAVREIGSRHSIGIEEKPAGVTVHFRTMAADEAERARDELIRGPATWHGVSVRNGHDIIELSVVKTNKGRALTSLRNQLAASAVLYLGDDLSDEEAFRSLGGPDVGVKVGHGNTAAAFRVADPNRVAQLLALLSEFRSRWVAGEGATPISDHSLLSDQRTAAVLAPDAAISWLCLPRIDSAAVFAQLLGGAEAGTFTVRCGQDRQPTGQRYRDRSMTVVTSFPSFTVTDLLDVSSGRTEALAGRSDLLRILEGTGPVVVEFSPRIDFGRATSRLELHPDGVVVLGTTDQLVLRAPDLEWELLDRGSHQSAIGRATLRAEVPLVLELRSGTDHLGPDPHPAPDRVAASDRRWSEWTHGLQLPSFQRETVARSALLVKALCHQPTGAVVSSATTSLPETLGGIRNWDHRYCWLRDGALATSALARMGSTSEGLAFLEWIAKLLATRTDPMRLGPVYSVTGRHLQPEAQIGDLPGYAGSRPVRIGHAAENLAQIDAFGPIVDLVHLLMVRGQPPSDACWHLVEAMVLAVGGRWRNPDHGVWESRQILAHHVHSKVMCWVGVDRAIDVADRFLDRAPEAWVELRNDIATEIIDRGWNSSIGSYTATYDGRDIDASVLSVGLSGLIPADDERFASTVAAVERELRVADTVYRYRYDDGLPGKAAGHHLATSWLIGALARLGRLDQAQDLFDGLCRLTGPTGLLSSQFDPETDRSLGNLPWLAAHTGLLHAALDLDAVR